MHALYFITLTLNEIDRYEDTGENSNNNSTNNEEDIDSDDDDDIEILRPTLPRLENTINTQNNSVYRRSSYPRLFPPIVSNTYENHNLLENPFQPTTELPRTPTYQIISQNQIMQQNQITQQNNNDISSRFNLGIR